MMTRSTRSSEREEIQGVVIDFMGNTCAEVLPEMLSIPVLGPAQTTMNIAATLGRMYVVLTVLEQSHWLIDDQVRKLGLENRYADCEVVDIPVLDFEEDPAKIIGQLCLATLRTVQTF